MTARPKAEQASLVTTREGFDEVMSRAGTSAGIGIDTEFLRERTYRARLCLVQVATAEQVWIIDPLAAVDPAPLGKFVADPGIEIIVHAGRQDLEIFYDEWGCVPENVFDVQLAAGFVGYGASLPYGRLVEAALGVSLVKGESYSDWCRRPLTSSQLDYAADDVRFLIPLADHLRTALERRGRMEWVEEEMRSFSNAASYGANPDEAWRRVTGRGTLSARQTAVLKELARWRELEAIERDIPRGWVVKDPTLIEIARRGPSSASALKSIRGVNPKEADRSGRAIVAAIDKGRNAPPLAGPPAPPRSAQARARMLSGLADAIVRARCEHAEVATELVATRTDLESLLVEVVGGSVDEADHRLLRGWRRDLAGNAVLDLARGRIAVKAIDKPPFIEEVPL